MNLSEKVIVITGGGQGLGAEIAKVIAQQGAHIALIDLNEDKLKSMQHHIQSLGVKCEYYLCNVAEEDQVKSTFAQIVDDFGQCHGLINNAGILRDGMLIKQTEQGVETLSLAKWQSVIDVNLTGVFLCGREFASQCVQHKTPGVMVNISSISRAGNIGQTNYSAAKAGVVALTVTWAKELARYGIRVGAIAPGMIETEMTQGMKPEALERMVSYVPLKRMGQPSEIGETVKFILENEYFSGRVIELDGAMRI